MNKKYIIFLFTIQMMTTCRLILSKLKNVLRYNPYIYASVKVARSRNQYFD